MFTEPLHVEHPCGEGTISFQVFDGVCGIYRLEGKLNLPPKQWLAVVRTTLAELEQRAKAEGFSEMRMSGRDWSRLFPDYERIDGDAPNLLRKRLI